MADLDPTETLAEFKHHVVGLTHNVLDIGIDDIPIHLQRYTIEVLTQIDRLLRQVACEVIFYNDHPHD